MQIRTDGFIRALDRAAESFAAPGVELATSWIRQDQMAGLQGARTHLSHALELAAPNSALIEARAGHDLLEGMISSARAGAGEEAGHVFIADGNPLARYVKDHIDNARSLAVHGGREEGFVGASGYGFVPQ